MENKVAFNTGLGFHSKLCTRNHLFKRNSNLENCYSQKKEIDFPRNSNKNMEVPGVNQSPFSELQ